MLDLDPDALLTTTRAVRKRLDFDRPVPRELIQECLEIAFQAPNGGNMNNWRWIVVDDPDLVSKVAAIYNGGLDDYVATLDQSGGYPGAVVPRADLISTSVDHLRELHRLPAVLVPALAGRMEKANVFIRRALGLDHPVGVELHARAAGEGARQRLTTGTARRSWPSSSRFPPISRRSGSSRSPTPSAPISNQRLEKTPARSSPGTNSAEARLNRVSLPTNRGRA